MTLEKALEILELNAKEARKSMPSDTLHALMLGIEALRVVKASRYQSASHQIPRLPGEST